MADDHDGPADEEMGYGRPPAAKRWKKGRSGNPRGRPRKDRSRVSPNPDPQLHLMILQEGNRPVAITQDGRKQEISLITTVIRGIGVSAARGNTRAQLHFYEMYQNAEKQRLKDKLSLVGAMLGYKHKWAADFERYDAAGVKRPDPVPHPDDIVIDLTTGDVILNGPRDAAERAVWRAARREWDDEEDAMGKLFHALHDHPDQREAIKAKIAEVQARMDEIDRMYPSEDMRRLDGFNLDQWRRDYPFKLGD